MSVSRCLGPAVDVLRGIPREQWSAHLDTLPMVCPQSDCTAKPGCRGYVAEYFRMQWRIQCAQERIAQVKAARAGAVIA